jgi:predicted transcriptional regulator
MNHHGSLHPKSYLTSKRNIKKGLVSRSKILRALEKGKKLATEIASETALSYKCVTYHLALMKKDQLVDRSTKKKPFTWGLTPYGQQELLTN